jgi:Na+-driven multidrug efflux pump
MPAYWAFWICPSDGALRAADRVQIRLRGGGPPWLGTGFAFLAVIINIPLNYALIWGLFGPCPRWG